LDGGIDKCAFANGVWLGGIWKPADWNGWNLAGGHTWSALQTPPSPLSGVNMGFGETILIVSDEQNLRMTLAVILQRAGYGVTTSGNADETLRFLGEKCFNLVFLDLKTTELNGMKLLPEIKRRFPGIPVIMLTALASNESHGDLEEFDPTGYLLKPIDPARIVTSINEMLKKRRSIKQKGIAIKAMSARPQNENSLKD
jgi:DNA-binding NtrC family response regulator